MISPIVTSGHRCTSQGNWRDCSLLSRAKPLFLGQVLNFLGQKASSQKWKKIFFVVIKRKQWNSFRLVR